MEQIARTSQQLGAAVRRRRRQFEYSQGQLGAKINLRQATISKLEAGEPGTQLKTLLDALAALDLEILIRPRTKRDAADVEALF